MRALLRAITRAGARSKAPMLSSEEPRPTQSNPRAPKEQSQASQAPELRRSAIPHPRAPKGHDPSAQGNAPVRHRSRSTSPTLSSEEPKPIQSNPRAPKGQRSLSPGQRPGSPRRHTSQALKGRYNPRAGPCPTEITTMATIPTSYSAPSGLGASSLPNPGRCPGLRYGRPVGAKDRRIWTRR